MEHKLDMKATTDVSEPESHVHCSSSTMSASDHIDTAGGTNSNSISTNNCQDTDKDICITQNGQSTESRQGLSPSKDQPESDRSPIPSKKKGSSRESASDTARFDTVSHDPESNSCSSIHRSERKRNNSHTSRHSRRSSSRGQSITRSSSIGRHSRRSYYSRSSSRDRDRRYNSRRKRRSGETDSSTISSRDSSESRSASRERYLKNTSKHRTKKHSSRRKRSSSRRWSPYSSRIQNMTDSASTHDKRISNENTRNGRAKNMEEEFRSCLRRTHQLLHLKKNPDTGCQFRANSSNTDTVPSSPRWPNILSRAKESFKTNSASDSHFFHPPPNIPTDRLYKLHSAAVSCNPPPPDDDFCFMRSNTQKPNCRLSAGRLKLLEKTSRKAMYPLTYLDWFLAALHRLIPRDENRMTRDDFNNIHDILDVMTKIWTDLAEFTVFSSAAFLQLRREAYLHQTASTVTTPQRERLLRQTPLTSKTLFNNATSEVLRRRRR